MTKLKIQSPDQVVDIAPLLALEQEYLVYPEGKREKSLLIWPDDTHPKMKALYQDYQFCKPGRRYLFKLARHTYPAQFWIEVFCYQLGSLIGVDVPPSFVAFNSQSGQPGALIEWFYDPENNERYVRGGDILQSKIIDYDRRKGKQHNFQSIIDLLSEPERNLEQEWLADWAKMLVFDALIGNTDRHQDNWGVVYGLSHFAAESDNILGSDNSLGRIAPAFDNGTSMGIEIQEDNFSSFYHDPLLLNKYIGNGKPHLKWDLAEDWRQRGNHDDLLKKIVQKFPATQKIMMDCLDFPRESVEAILEGLQAFKISENLSKTRGDFMLYLLCHRQKHLLSLLKEIL